MKLEKSKSLSFKLKVFLATLSLLLVLIAATGINYYLLLDVNYFHVYLMI